MRNRTYVELFDFLENKSIKITNSTWQGGICEYNFTEGEKSYKGTLTDDEVFKIKEIKKISNKDVKPPYSSEKIRLWCQQQDAIIRDEKLNKLGI